MGHSPSRSSWLRKRAATWPRTMHRIEPEELRGFSCSPMPIEVWRSREFLAQVFDEASGAQRISVNRNELAPNGRWRDGITWDELQRVKAEIGRGDRWAVEVYPPTASVVNVAGMRHLWLVPDAPAFAWSRGQA